LPKIARISPLILNSVHNPIWIAWRETRPETMQKYELLYIVPAQYTDEEVSAIQEKIVALVEKTDGKIIRNEVLGKIKLAYTINKVQHGSYVLVYFDADGSQNAELDRLLRLSDEVLRHTIIDRPEGVEEATFEISDYVAPLTPEGKRVTPIVKEAAKPAAPAKEVAKPAEAPESEVVEEKKEETKKEETKEETKDEAEAIAPPAPSETSSEESKMTMQELDQQLDKILDGDIGDNI
jgi:small subunit ribosomal protein S6